MSELIQLPMGDLWRAPVRDENGQIVPRKDNVDVSHLPAAGKMTPDVAAILMAERERLAAEAAAAAASK